MNDLYSIAICPPEEIVNHVRSMKLTLAERIGWFPSKNSEAHITFNEFLADGKEIETWKNFLNEFCKSIGAFEMRLSGMGSFPNGAFYLKPDQASAKTIAGHMKRLHENQPLPAKSKITNPHLTIGRQFSEDQLAVANELWGKKSFDLKFRCTDLAIRKFDPEKKQYQVERRFPLEGAIQLEVF